MTPTRQHLEDSLASLIAELRAHGDAPLWDAGEGSTALTAARIADDVEAHRTALIDEATACLGSMLEELVPPEFHAITLADKDLFALWPWHQCNASRRLMVWDTFRPARTQRGLPEHVTPADVATWIQPALKRISPSLADDGPQPWKPEDYAAEWADAHRRETAGEHGAVESLLKWVDAWETQADSSFMVHARGWTHPVGKTFKPTLRVPVLKGPTGQAVTWWAPALSTLYLANPVSLAEHCKRALNRLVADGAVLSAIARATLKEFDQTDTPQETTVGELAEELRGRLAETTKRLDVAVALTAIRARESGTIHPWDTVAVESYGTGAAGQQSAATLRAGANDRWEDITNNARRLFLMWEPQGDHGVPLFVEELTEVLWLDVVTPRLEQERERSTVPIPTVHPSVASMALWGANATHVHRHESGALDFNSDGWNATLPAAMAVRVAEQALAVDPKSGGRVIGGLVAWLARRVWERWQAGENRFDYVPMPAGRDEIQRRVLGFEVTEDELDRALEWLKNATIRDMPIVSGFHTEARSGQDGGRPRKVRVVHVGAALAPMGLESVFRKAGATLPPEFRFYGFVLEPTDAPVVGYAKTHARQRDAYSLSLGVFLTNRRLEYAQRGGVAIKPAEWRAELKRQGIYHRTHASLSGDILEAFLKPRGELWKRGPVLEETSNGSGVYRLGPDYKAQHNAILAAANLSEGASKGAKAANRAKEANRRKRKGRE